LIQFSLIKGVPSNSSKVGFQVGKQELTPLIQSWIFKCSLSWDPGIMMWLWSSVGVKTMCIGSSFTRMPWSLSWINPSKLAAISENQDSLMDHQHKPVSVPGSTYPRTLVTLLALVNLVASSPVIFTCLPHSCVMRAVSLPTIHVSAWLTNSIWTS